MEEREEARNYWKSFGFKYSDITPNHIEKLRELIKWELQTYLPTTDHARQMDMRISQERKKDFKFKDNKLLYGGLYVDGSYFTKREGIFFEEGGRIAFCGWADGENKMPFIIAFKKWCDWLNKSLMEKA
jgi:hypothetical protein